MCASEKGMTGMVEKLLAAGAKVETTDKVEGGKGDGRECRVAKREVREEGQTEVSTGWEEDATWWRGMAWYGLVWRGVVWCGVVWCGVVVHV